MAIIFNTAALPSDNYKPIPHPVVLLILNFLPRNDLLSISCASRQWRRLAMDPSLFPLIQFRLFNSLPTGTITSSLPFYRISLGIEDSVFGVGKPTRIYLSGCSYRYSESFSFSDRAIFSFPIHDDPDGPLSDKIESRPIEIPDLRDFFILTPNEFVYIDAHYKCFIAKVENKASTLTLMPLPSLLNLPVIQDVLKDLPNFNISFDQDGQLLKILFAPAIPGSEKKDAQSKKYILIYELDLKNASSCYLGKLRHYLIYTNDSLSHKTVRIERLEKDPANPSSAFPKVVASLDTEHFNITGIFGDYLILSKKLAEKYSLYKIYELDTLKLIRNCKIDIDLKNVCIKNTTCIFHRSLADRESLYNNERKAHYEREKAKAYERRARDFNRYGEDLYDFEGNDPDSYDPDPYGREQEPDIYEPEIVAKTVLIDLKRKQKVPLTDETKNLLSTFDEIKEIQICPSENSPQTSIVIMGVKNDTNVTLQSIIDTALPLASLPQRPPVIKAPVKKN